MVLNIAIGFAFVVAMSLLARTSVSWINGLIPLFPTFALIGQFSTYAAQGAASAKDVAFVGLLSLIPYAVYLLSVVYFTDIIGFPKAAVAGVALWSVFAAMIVFYKMRAGA